jgi:hypothetical protein
VTERLSLSLDSVDAPVERVGARVNRQRLDSIERTKFVKQMQQLGIGGREIVEMLARELGGLRPQSR